MDTISMAVSTGSLLMTDPVGSTRISKNPSNPSLEKSSNSMTLTGSLLALSASAINPELFDIRGSLTSYLLSEDTKTMVGLVGIGAIDGWGSFWERELRNEISWDLLEKIVGGIRGEGGGGSGVRFYM